MSAVQWDLKIIAGVAIAAYAHGQRMTVAVADRFGVTRSIYVAVVDTARGRRTYDLNRYSVDVAA